MATAPYWTCPRCGTGNRPEDGHCQWCGSRRPGSLRTRLEAIGTGLSFVWCAALGVALLAGAGGWWESAPGAWILAIAIVIVVLGGVALVPVAGIWVVTKYLMRYRERAAAPAGRPPPPPEYATVWRVTVEGVTRRVWVAGGRWRDPTVAWVDAEQVPLRWKRQDRLSLPRAGISIGGHAARLVQTVSSMFDLEVDEGEVKVEKISKPLPRYVDFWW